MPIINVDDMAVIVPDEYLKMVEDSKDLTELIVKFLNEKTDDYSVSANALAYATLLFIKSIRALDEETSEEARAAILEIISEGR